MRIELKSYQDRAIHNIITGLLPTTIRALEQPKVMDGNVVPYVMILKSIMGSGKTVIAAAYLEELLSLDPYERGGKETCVVWLSKGNGKLHIQSSDKLRSLVEARDVKIHGIEESTDFQASCFEDKDVYVINWEKLKEKKSNLLEFTENANIRQAIKNTDLDNMNFIFIVDEFHQNYEKDTYNLMVELFQPVFILGMTATPSSKQIEKADFKNEISVNDVMREGMIRKGICFNTIHDFEEKSIEHYETVDEFFLRMSLQQRDILEARYRKENSDVIPLLLVQFDNDVKNDDIKTTMELLDKIYQNNENDDYAVWISDKAAEKLRSKEQLISNLATNGVKVLLFKQAVATGWDCPRAQVLLRYRKVSKRSDAKSVSSFDIQTLGRIFRMPEPARFDGMNKKHYEDEVLNYGYVYVPSEKYELEDEFKRAYGDTDIAKKPASKSRALLQQELDGNVTKTASPSEEVVTTREKATAEVVAEALETGAQEGNSVNGNTPEGNANPAMAQTSPSDDGEQSFYEQNKAFIEGIENALKGKNKKINNVMPEEEDIKRFIKGLFQDGIQFNEDDSGVKKVSFTGRKMEIDEKLLDAAAHSERKLDARKQSDKEITVNLENPTVAYHEAEKYIDRLLKGKKYSANAKKLFKEDLINAFEDAIDGEDVSEEEVLGQCGRMILNNKSVVTNLLDDVDLQISDHAKYEAKDGDFKFPESVDPNVNPENKSYEHVVLPEKASTPERVFAELLDASEKVRFWYKCPDRAEEDAVVVTYEKFLDAGRGRTKSKTLYCCPDFLVAFEDGTIGIYETKVKDDYSDKVLDETQAVKNRIQELNAGLQKELFYGGLIHVNTAENVIVEGYEHPELGF